MAPRARCSWSNPILGPTKEPPLQLHEFNSRWGIPDPTIAEEVAEVVKPTWVGLDRDSWGLDHGAWSVLVHAFPKADIPVLQLSIDQTKGPEFHFDLGTRLAPLRERGILIVGSGNVVHNLRTIDWQQKDVGFDWAQRFDDTTRETMTGRPSDVLTLAQHPDFARAVPSPDHFYPLLYLAGLSAASGRPATVLIDGYAYGSLSMTCFTLDTDCPRDQETVRGGARGPDPRTVGTGATRAGVAAAADSDNPPRG